MAINSTKFFSIEEIVCLYPQLYTMKRLNEWRALFSDHATVVRAEPGQPVSCISIDEAMPEQLEYASENELFVEEWSDVVVHCYNGIAVVKANYRLTVDNEVREGVDVLTLIIEMGNWKIINLTYEQTSITQR
jgi:hypothetical protein